MTDYIRRIVSGQKARFKDGKVELDLVYITDQVIVMGYPASGVEGMYRNRREDAKKFLESRHGKNFWVFNFCPVRENSYSASFFDGRVSRYPFPDHHAPPLAILPLVAREMDAWLSGSPDRVAVLHCKAGKGRSGTMACTYILAHDDNPSPPQLERSYTAQDWAKIRSESMLQAIPEGTDDQDTGTMVEGERITTSPTTIGHASTLERTGTVGSTTTQASKTESLKTVLDLHTSRRMRPPSPEKKVKQGVSIPSQRRWLYYWALLLANQAPAHLWNRPAPSPTSLNIVEAVPPRPDGPGVRLTQIAVRLKEAPSMKKNLVRAANAIIDRANKGNVGASVAKATSGNAHIWVSLARYNDDYVDMLEGWERFTRDEHDMGKRQSGSGRNQKDTLASNFTSDKWDKGKMVRSFARMGVTNATDIAAEGEKDEKITTYTLRPLDNSNWERMKEEIEHDDPTVLSGDPNITGVDSQSIDDLTKPVSTRGVVLDAAREVRAKLYMGQIFMGWLWFIPTFHMSGHAPGPGETTAPPTKFVLTRKEIDFALGIGSSIVDVEITMQWLNSQENETMQPAARSASVEQRLGGDPSGAAVVIESLTKGDVQGAVRAKQGADD